MEKRIYSLNLIAYLWNITGQKPVISQDETNGAFYAVFPDSAEISQAITEWKDENCVVNIHSFLETYKKLREDINSKRGV